MYGDVEAASLDEAAPRRPISAYGRNKAAAEDLVFAARAAGRVASVVRYFSVYGPGLRKQLLWDACTRLARGDADFGGTGQEVRDWLHVADAIALLHRVADADHAPEVVNGGSGVGTSVGDVLGGLARALGRPAIVRFSGVAREGDPRRMVANVGVAHALGWRSSRALSEGLVEYARWFESAS